MNDKIFAVHTGLEFVLHGVRATELYLDMVT